MSTVASLHKIIVDQLVSICDDGVNFDQIEKSGLPEFINAIKEDLDNRTYNAQAVKRAFILKPSGRISRSDHI